MSFEETYDEMLHAEFSSGDRGKHAAKPAAGPALHGDVSPTPAHLEADAPIHEEFDTAASPAAVEEAPAEGEGPRGLARYRNAAMVGAGGLACAAVGAFLGGLGGYFTINPAAAHSLASSTTPEGLAAAANQAHGGDAAALGSGALGSATLTSLSGSLTQGIAPLQWLVSSSGGGAGAEGTATLVDLPGGAASGLGSGTGLGSGCSATESDLGLSCLLNTVTVALGDLGTASSDPSGQLEGVVPSLSGVVTDVTGTLTDLSSLLSTSSLPLPTGSGLSGLGSLGTGLSGATGSTGSTTPSLPLSGSSGSLPGVPSLPVTVPSTTTTTLPASSGSGTSSSSGTTTKVTVPLPALPVPISTPPVSVGGVSDGVSTTGSGSGLTLSLP